jgi:hypothetical protein
MLIAGGVVHLIDRLVFLPLRIIGRRRQPGEGRRSVIATQRQPHRAKHDDGKPAGSGTEQHRQGAEEEVVGQDDIGGEVVQDLLYGLVLSRNRIDRRSLQDPQVQFRAGGDIPEVTRELVFDVAQVEICHRREPSDGGAGIFDQLAHCVRAQHDDLVSMAQQCSSGGQ